MPCHMTDAQIAASIREIEKSTAWPPSAVIDTVAAMEGIPVEDVIRVYASREFMPRAA